MWMLSEGVIGLIAGAQGHSISHQLTRLLHDEFEIEHTMLQVDHEHTPLLSIEPAEQRAHVVRPAN